eukprot:scaffold93982_cov72-Phaeocystis_antarctica.AAC.2
MMTAARACAPPLGWRRGGCIGLHRPTPSARSQRTFTAHAAVPFFGTRVEQLGGGKSKSRVACPRGLSACPHRLSRCTFGLARRTPSRKSEECPLKTNRVGC